MKDRSFLSVFISETKECNRSKGKQRFRSSRDLILLANEFPISLCSLSTHADNHCSKTTYCEIELFLIDNVRILSIELKLACSQDSCGTIFLHANVLNDNPLHETQQKKKILIALDFYCFNFLRN